MEGKGTLAVLSPVLQPVREGKGLALSGLLELSSLPWEQGLSLIRLNLQMAGRLPAPRAPQGPAASFQAAMRVSRGSVLREVCPCSHSSLSPMCKLWLEEGGVHMGAYLEVENFLFFLSIQCTPLKISSGAEVSDFTSVRSEASPHSLHRHCNLP